ncbi:MAG: carboxyvinyl-carboxyphosphonate phosphorylmutase [Streptosporangiaceae bacterium]|nr:carboxyvinyl-carboxyphosphonate phosphorylmutase [Streptosporangiaceae bacterium]
MITPTASRASAASRPFWIARMIAGVLGDVPLIADADTGYGAPLNVVRTVREYERAGVAAIQLEDQAFPKRCGHLPDKELIPAGSSWPSSTPRLRPGPAC